MSSESVFASCSRIFSPFAVGIGWILQTSGEIFLSDLIVVFSLHLLIETLMMCYYLKDNILAIGSCWTDTCQ